MTEKTKDEIIVSMLSSFAGLSDQEAFSQLFNSVADTIFYIHRQRGNTTDEDLLEKVQWRLEDATGYKPAPPVIDYEGCVNDRCFLKETCARWLNHEFVSSRLFPQSGSYCSFYKPVKPNDAS